MVIVFITSVLVISSSILLKEVCASKNNFLRQRQRRLPDAEDSTTESCFFSRTINRKEFSVDFDDTNPYKAGSRSFDNVYEWLHAACVQTGGGCSQVELGTANSMCTVDFVGNCETHWGEVTARQILTKKRNPTGFYAVHWGGCFVQGEYKYHFPSGANKANNAAVFRDFMNRVRDMKGLIDVDTVDKNWSNSFNNTASDMFPYSGPVTFSIENNRPSEVFRASISDGTTVHVASAPGPEFYKYYCNGEEVLNVQEMLDCAVIAFGGIRHSVGRANAQCDEVETPLPGTCFGDYSPPEWVQENGHPRIKFGGKNVAGDFVYSFNPSDCADGRECVSRDVFQPFLREVVEACDGLVIDQRSGMNERKLEPTAYSAEDVAENLLQLARDANTTVDADNSNYDDSNTTEEPDESTPSEGSTTIGSGGGFGDPHIKSWRGKLFDFHGECDLLLMKSAGFASGAGLDLIIRTKIRQDWSYISSAAVRIGDDVLEVGGRGLYYVNGVKGAAMPSSVGGYNLTYTKNTKQHRFVVDLGDWGSIHFKVYEEFVGVAVRDASIDAFGDSVGMMGSFAKGSMLARDGDTVITNLDAFGMEWQVRDTEPMLFQAVSGPQYPKKCNMPSPREEGRQRRRLRRTEVTYAQAEEACAGWREDKKSCIDDVLATGNLGLALAGGF